METQQEPVEPDSEPAEETPTPDVPDTDKQSLEEAEQATRDNIARQEGRWTRPDAA